MCRQSDSSWRAASLSGGKLYSNDTLARARSAIAANPDGTESMDIPAAAAASTDGKLVQGNIRRKLWKSTCRAIADSEHVYSYERALYGAISGQTKSVLHVCETWEDHLWVHVNSLLEQEIDGILEKNANTNYFLSSSSAASEKVSSSSREEQGGQKEHKSVPQALQIIFNNLLAEPKLRLDARSPFHVAQSWIILNKTNDLLNTFVTKLEENAESLDEPQLAHLLRFFTHLILFLRLINTISSTPLPELPEASVSSILTSYLRVLQAHSASPEIIAFYSGSLTPSEGIEAYARYLYTEFLSVPNDAQGRQASERSERRNALLFAREAGGLDLSNTARRVVEMTLADVYTDLPDWNSAKAHFGLDSTMQTGAEGAYPNSREMELIRSIEWLTCDKETYLDALTQANALMRYFLCAGSPHLARKIVHQIPPDLLPSSAQTVDQPGAEDEISEYLDYTSFFDALQLHGQFSEVWSRRPGPSAKQSERLQYAAGIANLTNTLYDSIVELLTSEWLILPIDAADAVERNLDVQRRLLELQRIRAAYIPELVFRLHHALLDTGKEYVRSNLHKALELSNVVADERYKLYIEFMGDGHSQSEQDNRLKEYLGLVRQASLACLERQGDVFGGSL